MRRKQAPDDGEGNRADDNNGVAAEMRSRPFLAKYKTPDGVIKTDGKQSLHRPWSARSVLTPLSFSEDRNGDKLPGENSLPEVIDLTGDSSEQQAKSRG
jgi:hypothetical protein